MPHAGMLALYRELLALRRGEPALRGRGRERFAAVALGDRALALRRTAADGSAVLIVVALGEGVELDLRDRAETQPPRGRTWSLVLGTEEERFGGAGVAAPCDGAVVTPGSAGAMVLRA